MLTAAGRRYARALFELSSEENRSEAVRAELGSFAQLLAEVPELRQALLQPLHPAAERRAVWLGVAERLAFSTLLKNFFAFLIDQRRIVDFPAIREEFERLADEAAGRARAEVRAASPLSAPQRERLQRALSARVGRTVEMDVEIDASLLGGAIAKVGDWVFDGSLRTQLRQLHANLMKGH